MSKATQDSTPGANEGRLDDDSGSSAEVPSSDTSLVCDHLRFDCLLCTLTFLNHRRRFSPVLSLYESWEKADTLPMASNPSWRPHFSVCYLDFSCLIIVCWPATRKLL